MGRRTRAGGPVIVAVALVVLGGCGGRVAEEGGRTEPAAAQSTASGSTASGSTASESPVSESPVSGSPASGAGRAKGGVTRTPHPSPTGRTGTTVEVRIAQGRATPNGERVRVAVGEPVTFQITSDAPGELHLHATPEDGLSFGAGTTEWVVTLGQPGVAAVELHDPPLTLVQLEAR